MSSFLGRIADAKRREVERARRERPVDSLGPGPERPKDGFRKALSDRPLAVIAELKRRSPSKGALREDVDAANLARCYHDAGASAISVLTDRPFFGGSPADLCAVREVVPLPVLRKDFIVDPYQVHETRRIGADALLLIVRLLDPARLHKLLELSEALGIAALVEVHDDRDLETALGCGAEIIGVNSRDLDTFETDLDSALRLRTRIPSRCIAVAESGIRGPADVVKVSEAGFDACLVGEALMRSEDPAATLRGLLSGRPG